MSSDANADRKLKALFPRKECENISLPAGLHDRILAQTVGAPVQSAGIHRMPVWIYALAATLVLAAGLVWILNPAPPAPEADFAFDIPTPMDPVHLMETLERPFRESYTNELLAIQEDVTRVGRFMLEMVDTGI